MARYSKGQIAFLIALCVGLVSCNPESHPTDSATPPAQSSLTISGVVFDHTSDGPRPRANVPLLVRASSSNVFSFMVVTSDAQGRYSLTGMPAGPISIAPAEESGYHAPCPAGSGVFHSSSAFDVHVVSAALLSTVGAPPDFPVPGGIWVSGVVFERTGQGKQPVAGAKVNMDGDGVDPRIGSTTLTDAMGRYLVCPAIPSTGGDTYATVRITREGYQSASRAAFLGWDYNGFDIELVRN